MSEAAVVVARQGPSEFGGPGASAPAQRLPLALLGAHAAAALLLVWPAFWNGYPLVFADTGTYLGQALQHYLGWDRPPFYSLFLFVTGWRVSLWFPVLAQGAIMAQVIGLTLRALGRPEPKALVATAGLLAVFTGLPWFGAQLMPDLFTGLVVLVPWLLGFRSASLAAWERLWLMLLLAGMVAMHQSHLPLALGLAAVAAPVLWARRGWRGSLRPLARMAVPPLLGAVAIMAVNMVGHGRLSLSPYGSVFAVTRVMYDGPGTAYLDEACPRATYRICAVREKLPGWHNGFLWEPSSPLYNELGSPQRWAPEASTILWGTIASRPMAVVGAAFRNMADQMLLVDTGDGLNAWPGTPGPEPLIARFYGHELLAFRTSRQQRGVLEAEALALSPLHRATALLGALAVLAMLLTPLRRRLGPNTLALALLVVAAAIGNAAITGALSGPTPRYEARLAWLVVMVPAVVLSGLRLAPQRLAAWLVRPRLPG